MMYIAATWGDEAAARTAEVERRGRPVPHASFYSRREREQRGAIFGCRAKGMTVAAIAKELDLDEPQVETVLLSDRRRR